MPQTVGSYPDIPIEKPDEDSFGYRNYATTLADRIEQAETPFTIGIYGRWGSGKSSLMNLLRGKIRERSQGKEAVVETVWIDVWQLSNQEEVWQAFLQAVFGEVHHKLTLWQRLDKMKLAVQVARNTLRILVVITPLIVGLLIGNSEAGWDDVATEAIARGGFLATVGLALWTASRIMPIIQAVRETANINLEEVLKYAPFDAQISTLMQLKDQFDDLVKTLVKEGGRLIVFIDDLDRCAPEKIPDVLEAIKLFTTSEYCVYVLGMDHDIVRKSVKGKYKLDDEGASEYLEKIVQIPFHLPPLQVIRIEAFVTDSYPDIRGVCPTAPEVFAFGLEPIPRKVKRALNIYRVLFNIAEARVENGEMAPIEPELLAKMVVIQSRFRDLYKVLVRDQSLLISLENWAEHFIDPDNKELANATGVAEIRTRIEEKPAELDRPLVPGNWRPALAAMLTAGSERFEALAPANLRDYIYLTGTTSVESIPDSILFERSAALTPILQRRLQSSLIDFQKYFQELGYTSKSGRISVRIDPSPKGKTPNAYYLHSGIIVVDEPLANDPDVVFREYSHHALISTIAFARTFDAIESGLADYFPCSFSDNPLLGERAILVFREMFGEAFNKAAIRNLATQRTFSELSDSEKKVSQVTGEIWGAAFWEIRELLGKGMADKLLFSAWSALQPSDGQGDVAMNFVAKLLETEENLAEGEQIRVIFERRELL
jgi:energy-coupling factor transporter ATP-binding protein EcfA2